MLKAIFLNFIDVLLIFEKLIAGHITTSDLPVTVPVQWNRTQDVFLLAELPVVTHDVCTAKAPARARVSLQIGDTSNKSAYIAKRLAVNRCQLRVALGASLRS